MKTVSILLLATFLLPHFPAMANEDPHAALPDDLRQAVADFDRAQLRSDEAELDRLLADDYVLYNSQGQVEDKRQFIEDYRGMRLEPFHVEDETVRLLGDAVVMAGVATLKGTDLASGQPFTVRLRFSDIWCKRDGRWQVAFTQATRAP